MSKTKKSKTLIPKTAEQCNVSEELAEDVIDFYYSELRKEMESLNTHRIRVPVLGTFIVSRPKLMKSIKRLDEILNSDKPEDFEKIKEFNLKGKLKEKQEKLLTRINKHRDEQEERKRTLE